MAKPAGAGCLQRSLKLLARRPHFRRELAVKLAARNFRSDEIESTLDELTRRGLLDDRRHAVDLATGSMSRKGFGPRRVRAELIRRGVDDEIVTAVLDETFEDPSDELERARGAMQRWLLSGREGDAQLARHLDRKGFTKPVILRLLEEYRDG